MNTPKKNKELDQKKLKSGLDSLLKDADPMNKWVPVLHEVKPFLVEAQLKEISLKKIHKVFKESGANIPVEVLKNYMESHLN